MTVVGAVAAIAVIVSLVAGCENDESTPAVTATATQKPTPTATPTSFGSQPPCPAGQRTLVFNNNCKEEIWVAAIGGGVPACASGGDCPGTSTCKISPGAAQGNCACATNSDCNGGQMSGTELECNTAAGVCTFSRPGAGGWAMTAGQQGFQVCVETTGWKSEPLRWGGRFWGRTNCDFSRNNNPACDTGDCKGQLQCPTAVSGKPPVAVLEMFLEPVPSEPGTPGDSYDLSNVDGISIGKAGENIGIEVAPRSGTFVPPVPGGSCTQDSDCTWTQQCDTVADRCINAHNCANSGCVNDCQTFLKPSAWNLDSTCGGYDAKLRVIKATTCRSNSDCPGSGACNAPQGGSGVCVCKSDSECGAQLCGSSEIFNNYQACGTSIACATPNQQCSEVCPVPSNCADPGLGCSANSDRFGCIGTAAQSCYTSGAGSSCCGCVSWTPGSKNNDPASNGKLCQNHNPDWESFAGSTAQPEDYLRVFHNTSATGYSFAFDDLEDLMFCGGVDSANNVQYTVTFCPQNAAP